MRIIDYIVFLKDWKMNRFYCSILLSVLAFQLSAQQTPVKIVEEKIPNRIALYAINENDQDLDVKLTVTGTNIRQSRAKPRYIRVPATSKVHMKTIVLMRDKKPNYKYKLEVNDSLSNRALKKEYERIRINPPKPVVVYITPNCESCDSLLLAIDEGKYMFRSLVLTEKPEIQDQLQVAFGEDIPIDSLTTPVVNIGGKLYTDLEKYDQITDKMKED